MTRSQCGNKVTRSSVKSGEINAAINYTVLRAYTPLHTMRLVFFFFFLHAARNRAMTANFLRLKVYKRREKGEEKEEKMEVNHVPPRFLGKLVRQFGSWIKSAMINISNRRRTDWLTLAGCNARPRTRIINVDISDYKLKHPPTGSPNSGPVADARRSLGRGQIDLSRRGDRGKSKPVPLTKCLGLCRLQKKKKSTFESVDGSFS